tara:strand:+ start:705 stop:2075 length:1371 start_codon:yes stop_codon:yes gene_type:complete
MRDLMLICAPVSSRSGYGEHARDIVRSFIAMDKYDIKIRDVRWGDCPRNALDKTIDKNIIDCLLTEPTLPKQPEYYVDIRIPNEFEQVGKFNIGVTAGVETHAVSAKWIDCCNKMDLIIVTSEHSKKGFVDSKYEKMVNGPDGKPQKTGELTLQKPMEVLFEGARTDSFKKLQPKDVPNKFSKWLDDIVPEEFAFLFVGQWTQGGYGEDRKDIGRLVKVFYETFANLPKKPALILKTSGATASIMDRENTLAKLKQLKESFGKTIDLPNIYLLHGDLPENELNYLYNHPKVKAMTSFTHGEGFGRPLLEFTLVGKPVITTNWSGQLDFLDTYDSVLLPGDLVDVPKSMHWEDIIIPESKWFQVDEQAAAKALRDVFENYDKYKDGADNLMVRNLKTFTFDKMQKKLEEIMESNTQNIPKQVELKLPTLKKVKDKAQSVPKTLDIKLPKLKKVGDMA